MPQNKIKNKVFITQNEHLFFPELQQKYIRNGFKIRKLGTGTTGVVYQISPSDVIKVMPGAQYNKHINWYKETLYNLKTLGEKRKCMYPYHHFYMHSAFDASNLKNDDGTPKFIYEKMKYLPMDLQTYSKNYDWTLQDFIDIMCQVMHGIRLFHTLQYILTDLKVQNILYNPETKQLKLSDFCESYNTYLKPPNLMYTYYNRNNERGSKKEDVWRLGILMLNFMVPKVNKMLQQANRPILPAFLNTMKVAVSARPPKPYQYSTMIQPYLHTMRQTLVANCTESEQTQWKGIFHIIEKMMLDAPDQRPAVRHILASSVFCDSCLIPRVSYIDTDASKTPAPTTPKLHQAKNEDPESESETEPTTEPKEPPESARQTESESVAESESKSESDSESKSESDSETESNQHENNDDYDDGHTPKGNGKANAYNNNNNNNNNNNIRPATFKTKTKQRQHAQQPKRGNYTQNKNKYTFQKGRPPRNPKQTSPQRKKQQKQQNVVKKQRMTRRKRYQRVSRTPNKRNRKNSK